MVPTMLSGESGARGRMETIFEETPPSPDGKVYRPLALQDNLPDGILRTTSCFLRFLLLLETVLTVLSLDAFNLLRLQFCRCLISVLR
ncbi:hypothetical protein V5799_023505 [Amblyomma americanum]|uniref:Uncharacterized protein n=1 Tax=Amblyomma americanum TaxID=6943 RepID=A0AAQ4FJH3_AMBAM